MNIQRECSRQDLRGLYGNEKTQAPTTHDMGDKAQQDPPTDWDRMTPVGGEFGSPDYERLEELDHLAVKAKGSLLAARRWLDAPNRALDGLPLDEAAETPEGFARVRQLLTSPAEAR